MVVYKGLEKKGKEQEPHKTKNDRTYKRGWWEERSVVIDIYYRPGVCAKRAMTESVKDRRRRLNG